jgi:hypothetical protein
MRKLMSLFRRPEERSSEWRTIFLNSRVNGGYYKEDDKDVTPWVWPENTYLQRRLTQKRKQSVCLKELL